MILANHKIKVLVDHEYAELNDAQARLVQLFFDYKRSTLTNNPLIYFPTPPIGIQMSYPSNHFMFGRDTEFEYPLELINDIHKYSLSKVHVNTSGKWKPHLKQWSCTSHESIVYSCFYVSNIDTYVYVILDFLISRSDDSCRFDAHEHYTNDDIDFYLDVAYDNQSKILSELK